MILKAREPPAVDIKNIKKPVPEGLGLSLFGTFAFPFAREGKSPVFDFIQQ